jgi:hypothetical protein
MQNNIQCPNCGTENPFYKLTCLNCKTYLRDRIFNLDLWQITGLLIESPVKAFKRIIQSEHKNFLVLILILFSFKVFIDARFISIFYSGYISLRLGIIPVLLISVAASVFIIWIFTFILYFINKSAGLKTRIKDNNAVLVYSIISYPFALIILFPIELIIFGGNLFSNNPSPFLLKPTIAYTLLGFEILIVLWSIFLSIMGVYSISRNLIYSMILGLVFHLYLFGFYLLLSKILFI